MRGDELSGVEAASRRDDARGATKPAGQSVAGLPKAEHVGPCIVFGMGAQESRGPCPQAPAYPDEERPQTEPRPTRLSAGLIRLDPALIIQRRRARTSVPPRVYPGPPEAFRRILESAARRPSVPVELRRLRRRLGVGLPVCRGEAGRCASTPGTPGRADRRPRYRGYRGASTGGAILESHRPCTGKPVGVASTEGWDGGWRSPPGRFGVSEPTEPG